MILTIELVPKTTWYTNVRSHVTPSQWDVIRRKSYALANHRCEICGDTGKNQGTWHHVECHEIWGFNHETKVQKLIGFMALCPLCHKTKHAGLAQLKGDGELVIKQLMKVNKITRQEASEYIETAFELWEERSQHEWELDITMLDSYQC